MDLISHMDGSKVDWFVYLGHPKLQYPTYSPSITHEQFRLESKTESFITFSLEQETVLKHRGIFQSRKYCVEKTNQEAVLLGVFSEIIKGILL